MNDAARATLSKVPEVTLVFWIIKIAATTLGETGGDTVTMTLNWGYLAGTALFFVLLVALIAAQIQAKHFQPFLYWATIVASTTFGTTMADFADRSLGIGYTGGSALLLILLAITLALWYRAEGTIAVVAVLYFRTNVSRVTLFWAAFILTRPLGATVGDFLDKPVSDGGLALSRPLASAVIAAFIVICLFVLPQRAGTHPGEGRPELAGR